MRRAVCRFGLTRFAALAESSGLPAIVSLQNVYHLLKRDFDGDMAEVCAREDIGMMAFSPIATGILTGKYSGGTLPEGSRLANYPQRFRDRYGHPRALDAADRYVAIARDAGIDPAALAVAWVLGRPGVTSALPGAPPPPAARVACPPAINSALNWPCCMTRRRPN